MSIYLLAKILRDREHPKDTKPQTFSHFKTEGIAPIFQSDVVRKHLPH